MVRLTDRPHMTVDVYRGRKTTIQCNAMMRFSNFQYIRLLKCKDNHYIYSCFIVLIFAGSLGLSLYSINSLGMEQMLMHEKNIYGPFS